VGKTGGRIRSPPRPHAPPGPPRRLAASQGVYGYWPAQSEGKRPDHLRSGFQSKRARRLRCCVLRSPPEYGRQPVPGRLFCRRRFRANGRGRFSKLSRLGMRLPGLSRKCKMRRLQRGLFQPWPGCTRPPKPPPISCMPTSAGSLAFPLTRENVTRGLSGDPQLSDHYQGIRNCSRPKGELKMHLTPAYQLVPEQSTAAIIATIPRQILSTLAKAVSSN